MSSVTKGICIMMMAWLLAGCASTEPRPESARAEPPTEQAAAVAYYIGKLPDRDYVETYGDADNPRPWYTAAEALGEIGKPAIPALVARLDSEDDYELMLALYAMMLASQDPTLQAETGGDFLRLGTVLSEETNPANRRLALQWWQRYRHLWQ
ncbi:HEAT repeat domain-containing protein [Halomonas sp. ML-15]|uniref:HEAT repeat domain-containing protein n=1 Tax=Halomonas sp. ML-15 TaxID=2773305 RepID=UPI00174794CC|nr:HEAT repeat domain-containing protein [Halomonas sp. ML-15]MBD3897585.1 HEAT repeat domain-containing protein [Halomonas sp. ML-15]